MSQLSPKLTHYVSSRATPELCATLAILNIAVGCQKSCANCGNEVLVTLQDIEIIAAQNLILICTICAEETDFEERFWSPEAVAEMGK